MLYTLNKGDGSVNTVRNRPTLRHAYIYREGYETKWAYPLPNDIFSNQNDLVKTLIEFLQYCNVEGNIPVQGGVFQ